MAESGIECLVRVRSLLACVDADASPDERADALNASRCALGDARRAQASLTEQFDLFQQIVSAARKDEDPRVRSVAPSAIEDACVRDLPVYVREVIPILDTMLQDPNELVRMNTVRATTTIFRRSMGLFFACGVGELPDNDTVTTERFPLDLYQKLVSLHVSILGMVNAKHDGLANAALKFADPLVLALSYSGSGGAGSQEHFTLDFAHATVSNSRGVDVSALQADGKVALQTLAGYIHRSLSGEAGSGIRPIPFMTAVMVLGNLARRRKLLLDLMLPALVDAGRALSGTGTVNASITSLSSGQRASIVMVLRLSLQALRSYSHARVGPIVSTLASICGELSAFESKAYIEFIRKREEEKMQRRNGVGKANDDGDRTSVGCPDASSKPPIRSYPPSQSERHSSPPVSSVRQGEPKSQEHQSGQPNLPQRPVPPKRPRSEAPEVLGRHQSSGITPELASAGAEMLMMSMPPHELVNFLMSKLAEGPGDLRLDKHVEKKARLRDKPTASSVDGSGSSAAATNTAPSRRQLPRKVTVPKITVPDLSRTSRIKLLQMQCRRMLAGESKARASGAIALRILALARLLCVATSDDVENGAEFLAEAISHLMEDLPSRIELGLAWLHSEASSNVGEGDHCVDLVPGLQYEDFGCLRDESHARVDIAMEGVADSKPRVKDEEALVDEPEVEFGGSKFGNEAVENSGGSDENRLKPEPQSNVGGSERENGLEAGIENGSEQLPGVSQGSAGESNDVEPSVGSNDIRKVMCEAKVADDVAPQSNESVVSGAAPEASSDSSKNLGTGKHASNVPGALSLNNCSETSAARIASSPDPSISGLDPVSGMAEASPRYNSLLVAMVKAAAVSLGPEDRSFSRLVVEAPLITKDVLDLVQADCRDPARTRLGLSTLRDIIIERPGPDRLICLDILLNFTVDEDAILRGPAVRLVVGKVYDEVSESVSEAVVSYATRVLDSAVCQAPSKSDRPDGDSDYPGLELTCAPLVGYRIWLLTALCAKKPPLLSKFVLSYVKAPIDAREVFLARARDIAGQLGPESEALHALIRADAQPYSEVGKDIDDLALAVTSASIGKGNVSAPKSLVQAVLSRYEDSRDARLLFAILSGLDREQVVQYLPVIVNADGEDSAARFTNMVTKLMSARPMVISPSEFLIELHKMRCTQAVCAALKTCLRLKGVFKVDAISSALQKILEMEGIPELLMRTVLLARVVYPNLEIYIRETVVMGVQGLLRKKVWKNPILWKGFVQYSVDLDVKSLTFLVRIPEKFLTEILSTQGSLRSTVASTLANKRVRVNPRDRFKLSCALQSASLLYGKTRESPK